MSEKRQLLAIMFTDIVGYTAAMGEDESRAVEMLRKNRELHKELITRFDGEYLQEVGDGTLASFASAVDAVGCALELQRAAREDPDLNLRIGIHSGDVIRKDGDIVGDAVNVASRIEPLAATGGICVSGAVYESVRNKPAMSGVYLGAKLLKNVSEPVRIYGLTGEGLPTEEAIRKAAEKVPSLRASELSVKTKLAAGFLVLAALGGVYAVWQGKRGVESASLEKMALPLPDEPSIAVLPFDNMSGDTSQEYFSDGLTEDIITGLSKVPGLFVIARNSSFTYKGKPVKVQQVSEELGVRYVLEGSVRRTGDKVRITAQLIDALTGRHLWAEKYDRVVEDIFAVIDEITKNIMTQMDLSLADGEYAETWSRQTDSLEAYEKALRGREFHHKFNLEANLKARQFFEKSLAFDPDYRIATTFLADTYLRELLLDPGADKKKTWEKGMELSKRAIALNEDLPGPYAWMAYLLVIVGEHDKAVALAEKNASVGNNSAETMGFLGFILHLAGRNDEAVELFRKAMRLDPFPSPRMRLIAGLTYSSAGLLEEGIEMCGKIIEEQPDFFFAYACLAITYSGTGRDEEAEAAVAEMLRINPNYSLKQYGQALFYKDPADGVRKISALKKAGLPE